MADEKFRMLVGDRIREARKAKDNMSQEKLAEILGVSSQAVSGWESGKNFPDPEHLAALAKALDLSLDALFAEKEHGWKLKPVNFDAGRMFTFVKGRAQQNGLRQTLAVLDMLRPAHEKQPRWSKYGFDTTYMVHPLTMACHALAMGLMDDDVIAAVLAHDIVEDSCFTLGDLPVNDRVREAVRLVSKNLCDRTAPDWEKKYFEEILKNPLACLVKCLDRVNNLHGMADGFDREGMAEYTEETDLHYPAVLEALKKVPEWNDAWWLLRYQMTGLLETFKRML